MGPERRVPARKRKKLIAVFKTKTRRKTWFAPSKSFRPTLMAVTVSPPMVVSMITDSKNMMKGKEMLMAHTALIPTQCPTNMPSTMEKRKMLTMLSMEGRV